MDGWRAASGRNDERGSGSLATLPRAEAGQTRAASRDRAKSKRSGWQSAVVLEVLPRTPRINSVFLAPERPFSFQPGQHVRVKVLNDVSGAERSYSIASAPESGAILELAIEALPRGQVSGYFHGRAAPGDTVELRGPKGDFSWSVADGGPVLLIAGGSGLVPLMSMIRHRTLRKSTAAVGLVYSAITWDDVLFRDELLELAEAQDGFELLLTLTREAPSQPGVGASRIDAAMLRSMVQRLPAAPRSVFVCGSDPFVDHVQGLLSQLGIAPNLVHIESYGM
jgi:ferredoxin-NADP reductase